jgi:NADPH:quinone reductase-like Zn-dependent oxidoreductase
MFQFIRQKKVTPAGGMVFPFEEIQKAMIAQDSGTVNGKIVVTR